MKVLMSSDESSVSSIDAFKLDFLKNHIPKCWSNEVKLLLPKTILDG